MLNKKQIISILFIIILILLINGIVYFAGGTQFAFTHLMYIPIILSAFLLNMPGAVGAALLSGITLGPCMPVNVSKGTMQEPGSWLLRMLIFLVIGFVVGFLFEKIKKNKETEIEKSFFNTITGHPNASKLLLDLTRLIQERRSFSLVVFQIINMDAINRYVDYTIGLKSLLKAVELLSGLVGKNEIYSVFTNEFVVVMQGSRVEEAYSLARKFLNCFQEPIMIDEFPVSLVIKCGIVNYPLHGGEPNDIFKKMGRTLDQEKYDKQKIAVYEESESKKNKEKYETVVSIYEAIKSNQFYLVYQPIIDLKSNEAKSAEALLRWENGKEISPGELIKIAEDAEIIGEITKWVILSVMKQLSIWRQEAFSIKVAVNISSKDLKDESIIQYTTELIKAYRIAPEFLEFELTERVIVENENVVKALLYQMNNAGIKISLDDFGTGYNSLVELVKLPIDYLKLDKFLINNIKEKNYRPLIKGIIDSAHNLGKQVIAEGVETKEQLALLQRMNCDFIQGFYFSKPLLPEELKAFVRNADKDAGKNAGKKSARNS